MMLKGRSNKSHRGPSTPVSAYKRVSRRNPYRRSTLPSKNTSNQHKSGAYSDMEPKVGRGFFWRNIKWRYSDCSCCEVGFDEQGGEGKAISPHGRRRHCRGIKTGEKQEAYLTNTRKESNKLNRPRESSE